MPYTRESIMPEPAEGDEVLSLSALRAVFARLKDGAATTDEPDCPDDDAWRTVFPFAEPPDNEREKYLEGHPIGTILTNEADEDALTESESDEPGLERWDLREDPLSPTPVSILEAMLFVGDRGNQPLPEGRAAELMRNVAPEEIESLVDALNERYRVAERPYMIIREKEGYRMVLRAEYDEIRSKFYGKIREAKLSQLAVDVLAVVAYRQPITAEEVQTIRHLPSGPILTQLVRRGLLTIEQRVESKKKVAFYRTTERFLQLFGIASLDDLPTPEDLGLSW